MLHCRTLDTVCVVTVTSFIPDAHSTVVPWAQCHHIMMSGAWHPSQQPRAGRGGGGGGQAGAVFINIEPLRRSTTGSSGTNPADRAPGSDGDKRAASSTRGLWFMIFQWSKDDKNYHYQDRTAKRACGNEDTEQKGQ